MKLHYWRLQMRNLFIEQKFFTILDQFKVYDEHKRVIYYAREKFKFFGETFHVYDASGRPAFALNKRIFTWLPKYELQIPGRQLIMVESEFSFFRKRIKIDPASLNYRLEGDFWDLNFSLYQGNRLIGQIQKRFLSWTDAYHLQIYDERDTELFIAVVLAVDSIKDAEQASTTY